MLFTCYKVTSWATTTELSNIHLQTAMTDETSCFSRSRRNVIIAVLHNKSAEPCSMIACPDAYKGGEPANHSPDLDSRFSLNSIKKSANLFL
jgi:hypothetical protein